MPGRKRTDAAAEKRCDDGVVGGRKAVVRKVFEPNPPKLGDGDRTRPRTTRVAAGDEPQPKAAGGSRPDERTDLNLNCELFDEFAPKGVTVSLSGFAFSARKLPIAGVPARCAALTNEESATPRDEADDDNRACAHARRSDRPWRRASPSATKLAAASSSETATRSLWASAARSTPRRWRSEPS